MSRDRISEVGVLDKAIALLDQLAVAGPPLTLAQLAAQTNIHRATAHRLLRALEVHGLTHLDQATRWSLGSHLVHLGQRAAAGLPLREIALPALTALRDSCGESVQLYVVQSGARVCIASLESGHGLRTIVDVGTSLPLGIGSAGRVLAAQRVNEHGWIESVEEREVGVASVSAPITDSTGVVRGAISISGPIERVTRKPGKRYGLDVVNAAGAISQAAGWAN